MCLRLWHMSHPLYIYFLADWFFNIHHWILARFDNIFLIQNLSKDKLALKIQLFPITSSSNSFSSSFPEPALTIPFLAKRFPNKLVPSCFKILLFVLLFHFQSDSFQQNIRIFKSLNNFHYVVHFFVWNYYSCCSWAMYFLLNSCIICWSSCCNPNGAEIFFTKATTTFINGPANSLNNDIKIHQIKLFYKFDL